MSAPLVGACALLLGASGCLIGEVRGIPCAADDACFAGSFCDVPRQECREITNAFSPPVLRVKLITDPSGEQVTTPLVPPETTSTLVLFAENVGLAPAEDIDLSFAFLDCIAFDLDEDAPPRVIEAAATAGIEVDVTPAAGCDGVHIIDWFFTYSGRETRGIFDLRVKAEQRGRGRAAAQRGRLLRTSPTKRGMCTPAAAVPRAAGSRDRSRRCHRRPRCTPRPEHQSCWPGNRCLSQHRKKKKKKNPPR
jgi:hypothetical protein